MRRKKQYYRLISNNLKATSAYLFFFFNLTGKEWPQLKKATSAASCLLRAYHPTTGSNGWLDGSNQSLFSYRLKLQAAQQQDQLP